MRKRSVMIAGHATSVALEEEFWAELRAAAGRRGLSLAALIGEIDAARADLRDPGGLASTLRLFVLRDLKRTSSAG